MGERTEKRKGRKKSSPDGTWFKITKTETNDIRKTEWSFEIAKTLVPQTHCAPSPVCLAICREEGGKHSELYLDAATGESTPGI